MKIKLLFLILVFKDVYSQNVKLLEYCINELDLQYCSSSPDSNNILWNLHSVLDNHFTVLPLVPCIGLGYSFHWSIKKMGFDESVKDFGNYRNRSILFVEADSLLAGEYTLELRIDHKKTPKTKYFRCMIRLQPAPIIATIDGATIKNVHDGDIVKFDGSYSYTGGNSAVEYSWVGNIEGAPMPGEKESPTLTGYGEITNFLLKGAIGQTWKIRLTMTASNYKSIAEQTITIKEPTTPIIDIMQNCPAAGNYELLPTLTVNLEGVCYKQCDSITTFAWNVRDATLETFFIYGVKNSRFSANFGKFETFGQAKVDLYAGGSDGQSLAKVVLSLPIYRPKEGSASCPSSEETVAELFSVFQPKCAPMTNIVVNYNIKQIIFMDGKFFPLTLARNVAPEFGIRLTSYTMQYPEFTIENAQMVIVDQTHILVSVTQELPANFSSTRQVVEYIYSNKLLPPSFFQNPTRLGNEGRVWEAIQVINALMPKLFAEESDKVSKQFSIKLCTRILRDILNFPTDTILDSLIIVLLRLMRPASEPKVREYALALSNACRHLAVKRKDDLRMKNALLYESEVHKEYNVLKKCANYLMTPNYQKHAKGVITTPPPLEDHLVIVEDYPCYEDIIMDNKKEDYIKITNNTIEIAKLASFIRIATWAYGEMEFLTEARTEYFQAEKVSLVERKIEIEGCCNITLPQDIGFHSDEKVRLIINIFNESLFFWETSDITVNTMLVNLRFVDKDGDESYNLPELVDVFLQTYQRGGSLYKNESANLPPGHTEFNDTNIAVFRIDMRNSSSVRVVLKDIAEPMRMVILQSRRPLLSDFGKSVLVSGNYSHVVEPLEYDDWLYMAVLPVAAFPELNQDFLEQEAISMPYARFPEKNASFDAGNETGQAAGAHATFRISVLSQECVEWKNNEWVQSDCKIGRETSESIVHCKCYSVSNVAAFSLTPNLRRRDVIVLYFVLDYSTACIPMILIVCVIAAYCVAIIFAIFRRSRKQQIYYLGDNVPTHNYAYLVVVKTNDILSSGTSSNVVIKVNGGASRSRPHVLNYPDPDKNLLQCRSEDYFILTTRQHLGELKSIELWIDCLQIRPTWRCDDVKICDLQTRKWYLFEVENLFSPLRECEHYLLVEGTEIQETERRRITFKRVFALIRWRFGAEHTWNIFSRKDDEWFYYVERLSIILSSITTTYAAALLLSSYPRFQISDAIFDNPIVNNFIFGKYALMTCVITFTINQGFVFMFRNLTRKRGYKYFYKRKILPEKMKFVNWTLLCLTISGSIIYVLLMSPGMASDATYVWLIVTTLSLIMNIFIFENLYLIVIETLRLAVKSKMVYNYKNAIAEGQYQKNYLNQIVPGRYSLRPYLIHLYKPMDTERHMTKRKYLAHRYKISKTFKDFIAFAFYFLFLYILVPLNINDHTIVLNQHMREMMEGIVDGIELEEIKNMEQLIEYLNETHAPTLHSLTWYGNYSANDPGLMMDFQTKFLGVARVRQKRVITTSCPASEFCAETFGITKCIPPYSTTHEDTKSLTETQSLWRYNNYSETGSTQYYGELATYYGGGYVTYTGRTLENAYHNIDDIKDEEWFDKYTRAVFIEFWAYNANTNLFSIVTVTFEFSLTGHVEKSYMIYTLAFMYVGVPKAVLLVFVFSLYCLMIFYQVGNTIMKIIGDGVTFWRTASNYLYLVILFGNLAIIGLYTYKQLVVERILEELSQNKRNQFTKYFLAEQYCNMLTIFIAVLMCISVMGTWRFLRFGFVFKVFERAINTLVIPLLSVFIYTLVIYFLYVIISYLLFGSSVRVFRSLSNSITVISLYGMEQFKNYDHDEVGNLLPVISMIFFAFYRLSLLMTVNVYIAVIILHYEDSRSHIALQEREFSILTYFIEEFKYFIAYIKTKKYLRGGTDYPSHDDQAQTVHEKFNDEEQASGVAYISSNKLVLMSAMIFAHLYNGYCRQKKKVLTDQDYELMRCIVWYNQHRNEGERTAYYRMQIDENVFYYMSKNELSEMIMVINRLFEPEPDSPTGIKPPKPIKPIPDKHSLKKLSAIANSLQFADIIVQNIDVKRVCGSEIRSIESF